MKKFFLSVVALASLASGVQAGNWSRYDSYGNWSHGHFDRDGYWSGYDQYGRWFHGHTDSDGYYSGYDSNGNWFHGHIDIDPD